MKWEIKNYGTMERKALFIKHPDNGSFGPFSTLSQCLEFKARHPFLFTEGN